MRKGYTFATAFLATTFLGMIGPVNAAEVSADRLIGADKEPQNWLMNHRTYDAQRYSPLDRINKSNAKDLKLAYAVALGGTSANAQHDSRVVA
jgi:alcohol dehydrogenase (cytochrome c)